MAVWSLIPFSETLATKRLDAEHYQPKFLAAEIAVGKVPHQALGELAASIKRGVQPVYEELGTVPVLRSVNVQNGGLSGDRQLHVSQEAHDKIVRGQARQHDVLLTSTGVGTLGRAAALDTTQPYFADGHITIIRRLSRITPFYLSVFLMSETGQLLIYRRHRGSSGQIEIYPEDIASIPVPIPPVKLLQELEQIQKARVEAVERSAILYNEAEALLLQELGLGRMALPTAKTYTAPFAEVMAAERMDAEFFRPQHRFILEHLRNKFAGRTLGELGTVTKGKTPAEYVETGIPVVRSGDLSDIDATASFLQADPADVRFELQTGDVLISSIGFGSIGKVQVFNSPARHTTVNEVTVVRQQALNPYYLRTFLASPLGQIQIESWVTGATGQLHLNPKDVMKIVVPMVLPAIQAQFETLYVEAQRLKLEAVELLAAAQRRVEEFISA